MEFPEMEVELFPGLEESLEKNKHYQLQYEDIQDYSDVLTKYVYTNNKKNNIEREIIGDMCRLFLQENTNLHSGPKNKKIHYIVNLEKQLDFDDIKFPGNIFKKGLELDTKLYIFIVFKLLYQRGLHEKTVLDYSEDSDKEIKRELYFALKNSSDIKKLQKIILNNKKYTELVKNVSQNIHLMQLIMKQTTFNGEIRLKLMKLHCKLEKLKLEDLFLKFAFHHSKNEYESDLKIYPDPKSEILNFEINLKYVFYLTAPTKNCKKGILTQEYKTKADFSDLGVIDFECLQYKFTYHIKLVLHENNCSLEVNIELDKLFREFSCIRKPFLLLDKKKKSKLGKRTKKKSRSTK